jgi:hypothetical protein
MKFFPWLAAPLLVRVVLGFHCLMTGSGLLSRADF